MLSKYNLYPSVGGAIFHGSKPSSDTDLLLWLLFLCDGLMPIEVIAEKIGVDASILEQQIQRLLAVQLIKEI
jgi:aminopeptidase-like protein